MEILFLLLPFFVILILPQLIVLVLLDGLIKLIRTKSISNTVKVIIIIIALIFMAIILINIVHEDADDLYTKMKTINDTKSIIGFTKEDVNTLLGNPKEEYKNKSEYFAGTIKKDYIWGGYTTEYYKLLVNFDENNIVQSTLIKEIPRS